MFDLFRSREKSVRYLLGALLVLVGASMLTYLIPNYDTGAGGQEFLIAKVGDYDVQLREVQLAIQNMMRSRQMPAEMLPIMVPQMIEGMVTERAMAYEAERQGFKVSDEDIAHAIRQMIPSLYTPDGKFIGRDQYAAMLAQQNVGIQEFEADVARQVLVNRLRNMVLEGVMVSPQEVEQEFRQRNEKVKIEYVKIPTSKYAADVQVTPEEIKAHYDKNRASFQTPEKRNLQLLVIDQEKVEQTVQVSGDAVRRAYEQDKDRFRTPERVKVRHILLTTTGKTGAEEATIRAKAEGLLKQIRGGANFAELAKANSQDPGSAATGGELPNWVTRGQTVPEFEKVAFSLPIGQTSELVKTQYGYHIIQVIARENARLQPFEEAKNELLPDLKRQLVTETTERTAAKLQEAVRRNPQQVAQIAQQFNVRLVEVPNAGAGEPLPEVGVSQDFDSAISGLRKGEVSQPVQTPGNKTVLAVVKDIVPAHPATLEEVEAQIRDTISREKAAALLAQRAGELADKVKAGGDLKKIAQSMGFEVKTSDDFTRQGAVEGVGSANYLADAFTKPVGTVIGPVSIPDGRVVAKIAGKTEANLAELAAQRDTIREELKNRKGRERNALFEDGLRQRLTEQGKIKIYQDVVNRLTASYRG